MFKSLAALPSGVKQYLVITGNYWAFTLTDGALRMLVVLYFYQLGYDGLSIAMLFLFYEFFGVVTNLFGGYLGARLGLNKTMNLGLVMQVIALGMLAVPAEYLSVAYVMAAQALSGIAKDLNKMSAKSAIKTLIPKDAEGKLFKWVAVLTGSKNALKGVGFFMGGLLLTLLGFQNALLVMSLSLFVVWTMSLLLLKQDLGKKKHKPKFKELFSKSANINVISAARLFLFASRDVWFVVALPVYLAGYFDWDHWSVGTFMACWVIGYGLVQSLAPKLTKGAIHYERLALIWVSALVLIPAVIALALYYDWYAQWALVAGLMVFGAVFAFNSSLHSFLIVRYADSDGVSMDVGFYYMANATGRLLGTILSGAVFVAFGMEACLVASSIMLLLATGLTTRLSRNPTPSAQ